MPPEPVDVSSLIALRQMQRPDGPDRVGLIIARFVEEASQRIDTIRLAASAEDPAALEAAAHALKGIAGTVGANELSDVAREVERLARSGTTAGAEAQLAQLDDAWQRARPTYEELRRGVSA